MLGHGTLVHVGGREAGQAYDGEGLSLFSVEENPGEVENVRGFLTVQPEGTEAFFHLVAEGNDGEERETGRNSVARLALTSSCIW